MFCAILKRLANTSINATTCLHSKRDFHLHVAPLQFRFTAPLSAEPLKKKKKLDPAILKMREDRKKRRLEKDIKKLERVGHKFKPLDELQIPSSLLKEIKNRQRAFPALPEAEVDRRAILLKEWTRYRGRQHVYEVRQMERMLECQQRALQELQAIAPHLYTEAIQCDPDLLPWSVVGPTRTPPDDQYDFPDGEYTDVTKKWI